MARSVYMYALQLIATSKLSRVLGGLSKTCALSFEILWYYTNASSISPGHPANTL